jgi:DeoR family glycerol-3-phosphate regulon repressor
VLQAVLGQVRQTWLVVDASKFMQAQPTVVSHLSDMHRVFTEALPPAPLPALMHEWGVGLTIAP